MRVVVVATILFSTLPGSWAVARAQLVQTPPESTQGVFGTPAGARPAGSFNGLDVTADLTGGYDANQVPTVQEDEEFPPFQSGPTALASGMLRYRRGNATRFFGSSGGGSVNYVQLNRDVEASRLLRGEAAVRGAAPIGRRAGFGADFGVSYEPSYIFNALSPLAQVATDPVTVDGPVPPFLGTTPSITPQRWLGTTANASVFRNLTSRQRLDVQYGGQRRQPLDGTGLDSSSQSVSVNHLWRPHRSRGLELIYRLRRDRQVDQFGVEIPLDSQTAEGRLRVGRQLSPTKRLSVIAGGGAVFAKSISYLDGSSADFVAPIVSGAVTLEVTNGWRIWADARRDVMMLEGLTREPFESTTYGAGVTTNLSRRLRATVSAAYSRGASTVTTAGTTDTRYVTTELQYGLNRYLGLLASYSHYQHHLQDVAVVASSFPLNYNRNAVRVGLTMWLPLYGAF